MAYRATKSGLAKEAQNKTDAKYDEDEARKCLHWMQLVAQLEEIPADPNAINPGKEAFWELLRDGLVLCKVIDKVLPGKINWNERTFQVPKIEGMRVMRERERIALFSKYCQEYGVSDTATFPTESLSEKVDLSQVTICIRALGIEAQAKNVGPADYWPKKSERQSRNWTDAELKAGQSVIGLQMGTNKGASQAGMNLGKQRMIYD